MNKRQIIVFKYIVCSAFLVAVFILPRFSHALDVWNEQTASGSRMWLSIASSSDGTKLVAVTYNGYIHTSTDSGVNWTQRTSAGSRLWTSTASSSDGTKLVAGVQNGYIYTSTDSGANWTERTTSGLRSWRAVTSSSDGTKLVAVVDNSGYIYTSTDSGANWTERTGPGLREWYSVASSSDGTKLAAVVVGGGYIYTSTDSGVNWTQRTGAGFRNWRGIASSSDGTKLAAVVDAAGYIYTSTDSGVNWTERTSAGTRFWYGVTSSSDGTKLAAINNSGYVYTSTDSGVNWIEQTVAGTHNWFSITSSSDGTKLVVVGNTSYIYTYGPDILAPTISETTPVTDPTNDSTPDYTFTTSEAGNITYGGDCTSSTPSASIGPNIVTFSTLGTGVHSNCTIKVTDASNNESNIISVTAFTIDTTAPTISETTPVTDPTNDSTPDYTFTTSEAGNITYGGDCTSSTPSASSGSNTVAFSILAGGTHTNCTVRVTDAATNQSNLLSVTAFTITFLAPVLTTNDSSDITTTTVTLNGEIVDTGGENVTERGFEYGLDTDYGETISETGDFGAEVFSLGASELSCGTTYHFRSYAINSDVTGVSIDDTFSTSPCSYWYKTGLDPDWTTLAGNWWDDASHTMQSAGLPDNSSFVVTLGSVGPNVDLDFWIQPTSIDAAITGITFTSNFGNGLSINVSGDTTFNFVSNNQATITGNVTFNDSSINYGNVSGDTIFSGESNNQGTVEGDATFIGDLSENYNTVNGIKIRRYTDDTTTTRDFISSGPWTIIADGAVVNILGAQYDGTTTLETEEGGSFVEFSKYWYKTGLDANWTTLAGNWWDDVAYTQQSVELPAGNDVIKTLGIIAPNVDSDIWVEPLRINASETGIIFTSAVGNGSNSSIVGNPTYNGLSYNNSIVSGNAFFNDSSVNYNTVSGNARFTGMSNNQGTIEGDACFDVGAENNGTVNGSITSPCPALFTLAYSAGLHGSLTGDVLQEVEEGDDGTAVTAVPDSGYEFIDWSDDVTDNPRTDTNISGDISVTANFSLIPDEEPEHHHSSSGSSASLIARNLLKNNLLVPAILPNAPIKFTKLLKLKTVSEEVRDLQKFLNTHGFPLAQVGAGSTGQETSYFGPKTFEALKKFQASHPPLVPDGILGPKTIAVINASN